MGWFSNEKPSDYYADFGPSPEEAERIASDTADEMEARLVETNERIRQIKDSRIKLEASAVEKQRLIKKELEEEARQIADLEKKLGIHD